MEQIEDRLILSSLHWRVRLRSCFLCRSSRGVPPLIDTAYRQPGSGRAHRFSPCDKIIFHRKFADLGVKVFDLAVLFSAFLTLSEKHPGHAFYRLPFPRAHLRWVQLPLGRDLLHRLVPAQRLKRHSRFKLVSQIPSLRHSRIHSFGLDTS